MNITILVLKKCCNHGYKEALKLKVYLDSKGYTTAIHSRKAFRFEEDLKAHGKVFDKKAIFIVKELDLYLEEGEVDNYIKGLA